MTGHPSLIEASHVRVREFAPLIRGLLTFAVANSYNDVSTTVANLDVNQSRENPHAMATTMTIGDQRRGDWHTPYHLSQ